MVDGRPTAKASEAIARMIARNRALGKGLPAHALAKAATATSILGGLPHGASAANTDNITITIPLNWTWFIAIMIFTLMIICASTGMGRTLIRHTFTHTVAFPRSKLPRGLRNADAALDADEPQYPG